MAAEIELKIQNQQALEAVKAVLDEVKNLENQGTKISLGDIKKYTALVNATKKVSSAERELENQTNARLRAQLTAQRIATEEARTLKEIANAHKSQANAIKATDQAQNQLNKTMTSGVGLAKNMGSAMMSFTKQLIGFYGVTSTLRKAFTEMKAMNDELVTYRKVTGATAADMQKMQSAAYSAAKQYGQSPSDFLASAATMARAGYKENSAAMAELATKAQLVGDMTADQASKFLIAVDAAYKYGGSIEKLGAVLDASNEIDNRYATTIEKISEGMTLVASVAATAQVPIEQLMAALGTMTATTQREGSEAARGLRYILLHAMGDTTTEIEEGVTATEEGIQTLNEAVMKYGDEATKAALKAGKMINPMEKIVALQKAYQAYQKGDKTGLSPEALYQIGTKVAGIRQYNMFAALVTNPDMYNSMMKDIANSAGSADREWQAMMDSWSKKLEKLKATFTELVNNTISTDFIKSLIDAGTGALEFAGNLENLATMATGAYMAIKALSTGLGNLSKNQKFGSFNKWGIGLGIGIAAIGALKAYGENQFTEATAAAKEAASESDKIISNAKNLNSLIERYKEITADGLSNDELEEAKNIQEQIKGIIGEQAKNYDLLNQNVQNNISLLKQANVEYLKSALTAAKSQTSSAGLGLYNANANIIDKLTGAGLRLDQTRINKNDVKPEVWEALLGSSAFTTILGNERGSIDRVPVAVQYSNTGFKGIMNQILYGTYGNDYSADRVLEIYDSLNAVRQAYESAYSQAELETNNVYRDMVSGLDHIKEAAESYRHAINNEYSANAMLILAEEDYAEKKFESKEAVKQYTDELAKSKGLNEDQAKALYDLASSMVDIKEGAEDGSKGMQTASTSAITLADAIKQATAAKNAFDEAMKTSKADAFNDYTKAFQTLQKEMDAGRVNSNAFYAAAEMLMGAEAYAATGGSSSAIRKALNKRTAGDSGSALDAYKILSDTYKDYSTGETVEGFGFVELLRRTKGYGDSFVSDEEGNIVIPALTSDQIAKIADAWHIDTAFLMAAWNAFDQYDKNGTRQQDDLMDRVQETSEEAAEGEKTLAEAQTQATSATAALGEGALAAAGAVGSLADAVNAENNASAQNDLITSGPGNDLLPSEEIYKDFIVNLTLAQSSTEDAKTILAVINALNKEGGYELDITSGGATDVTSGKVTTIEAALQAIENMKKDGVITADVAGELKGHLLDDLEELGFEVDQYRDNPPEIKIEGDATPAKEAAEDAEDEINSANPEMEIGVNDFDAKEKIAKLEEDGHKTIYLEAKNAPKAENTEPGVFLADGTPATAQDLLPEGFPSDTAVLENDWWDTPDGKALEKKVEERWAKIQEETKTEEENYLKCIQDAVDAANKKVEEERAKVEEEEDVSVFDDPNAFIPKYTKAGEEAGQAFAEAEKEAVEEEEEDISVFSDPDAFTPKYSEAGEKAGEAFAEAEKEVIEDEEEDISVFNDPNAFTPAKDAAKDLDDQLSEKAEKPVEVEVEDDEAKKDISDLTATQTKTVYVKLVGGGGVNTTERFATGTRNHPGGLSLVNDGSGPELIVNDGQAFIAGGGKPTIVSLSKGAKVFTASETRQIFGGSVPAYADGTSELVGSGSSSGLKLGNIGTGNKKYTASSTSKKITSKKKSNSRKSSSAKVDEKAFSNLSTMVDYIIGRIGDALDEQLDVIDAQIEALKKAREAAEEQNKLEELQKNVTDALNERTVRYLGEDGKWHWMADQKNVQQAQKALKEYQDELEFNAQVNELEQQKKALQDEYNEITKTWSGIKDAVNTPTGSLSDLINQVLANGTAQQKAGAQAVSGTLINDITGSIYTKNYDEALSAIAKATAGNPVMPGSGAASLASLIATAGAGATEASITEALKTAASPSASITGSGNTLAGGNQTNINYFIDGIKLGEGMENQPLSSIMKNLSVYTNTGVN